MTEASMLEPIREQLATDHATLKAAVERVPDDWRDRRVHPDRWSVAEILEHLGMIEKSMVMLMTGFVAAAPLRDGASGNANSDDELRGQLLDRSKLIAAPDFIQPVGAMDSAAAMQALDDHRAKLLDAIRGADARDLSVVSRPHRVLGNLNGYQWLLATAGHEARHAAQIAELAEQIGE